MNGLSINSNSIFDKYYVGTIPWYNIKEMHVEGSSYSSEINAALQTHDFIIFPEGLYELDSPIKITRNNFLLFHGNAELKATVSMDYLVGVNPDNIQNLPDSKYTIHGVRLIKPAIIGGFFNCNNLAANGLVINSYYHTKFEYISIVDFTNSGVICRYNNGVGGGSSGLNNVTVRGANADYGFVFNSADDIADNLAAINCKVGYYLNGGNLKLTGCTAWLGYGAQSLYEGSVGFKSVRNVTSAILNSCNMDTMQIGIYAAGATGLCINSLMCIWNYDVIDPTKYENPPMIIDCEYMYQNTAGLAINGLIDMIRAPHYFCKMPQSNIFLDYAQFNGINFAFDAQTYLLDYNGTINQPMFSTHPEIDGNIYRSGNNIIIDIRLNSTITIPANIVWQSGMICYPLPYSPEESKYAIFWDSNGNIVPQSDLSVIVGGHTLALTNKTNQPITLSYMIYHEIFPPPILINYDYYIHLYLTIHHLLYQYIYN